MKQIFARLLLLIAIFPTTTLFSYSQGIGSGNGKISTNSDKAILSAQEIAQRFLPGVTLIICDDGKGNYSQGSGFFIAPGMILTNAHLVKGMVRGVVITGKEQKKNLINAVAYFNSENTDLALLVSDEAKKVKIPILPLAQPNDLSIGETIYVLSNPKGLTGTISQGIVSSEVRKTKKMDLLQITAPISEGSSGGAVMNSRGEVIGIATSSLQSGQNLNFAVPAAQIRLFLEEFADGAKKMEYVSASKFPNSWLAPKSFLSQSEGSENKKTSPSVSSDNSTPSFEEVKLWLSDKLVGRSFIAGKFPNEKGNRPDKTERLVFDRCDMYVEQKSSLDKVTFIYLYRVNMNFVKETAFLPSLNNNLVSLILSNDIPYTTKGYAVNNYTDKPDLNDTDTTDVIKFATDNKDASERVEKAFNFIIKVCKENVKEPF